jgi:hypothetical protein
MTIQIDIGIPTPTIARYRLTKYPWGSMQVGDSFLFPNNIHQPWSAVRNQSKRNGRKFLIRNTPEGYRCWRVE